MIDYLVMYLLGLMSLVATGVAIALFVVLYNEFKDYFKKT
jgi:hypothetical protein